MKTQIAKSPDIAQAPRVRRLLTLKEAAGLLQVSVQTLRRRIADRTLKHVRVGRQIRIKPADLENFVAAGEAGGNPEALAFTK